jgi:chlorophyll synthase
MSRTAAPGVALAVPSPGAVLELLKPVTWFPPMWAFGCGVVSSGLSPAGRWHLVVAGIFLAGPLLCATSQVVNDWFDRHVDAINEPGRPIPSGRIPGRWGLYLALLWTVLSAAVAAALGPFVLAAAGLGLLLAWAYSAPPVRLKQNGWWGNAACGLSYEGLAWLTGASLLAGGAIPDARIILVALLYSAGAHGIMTLNDFKSLAGNRALGVGSLPVRLGPERAAHVACWMMAVPQVLVVALLVAWDRPWSAALVALSVLLQGACMLRLLRDPRGLAPWYNATGVSLFVLGMLVTAIALGHVGGGAS